jgi:polyisoprenoid-binding protein YceI
MKAIASLSILGILSAGAFAQAKTFTFGPGLQANQLITVESNTAFEDFVGRTTKVSGSVTVDLAKKTGSGKIVVDLASLGTGLDLRDEHMRSEGWLNVAKYPTAVFEATSIKNTGGKNFLVTGNFTLHGVTKSFSVKATANYVAESEKTKANRFNGDVIQIKTKFTIKASDYGIKIPAMAADKVSNSLTIGISVIGTTK